MKRKVGFWRWLFDGAKELPTIFIEGSREPFGEMMSSIGLVLLGLILMPTLFGIFNIGITALSGLIYLGVLFASAVFLMLHGIYRDEVR